MVSVFVFVSGLSPLSVVDVGHIMLQVQVLQSYIDLEAGPEQSPYAYHWDSLSCAEWARQRTFSK